MPNVGRPSGGCKHCRDRKVKCDQKRPSCSQCIRSGKECHGYRDALTMMFKDETAVVAKKAKKRYEALASERGERQISNANSVEHSQTTRSNASDHSTKSHFNSVSRCTTPESMMKKITPLIESEALGFFISNYVSQPTLVPKGQYEWVLEALSQPNCSQIVRSSVNAASLAGLASATKSSAVMARARVAYGSALSMTNGALRNKDTAIKDSTLVSVIMLGLYENFVFHDKRSLATWAKHVQGASAILNLRGKKQFESDTARRIFHQLYGLIMLVSLESGQPVPDGIRELYDYVNPTSDYAVHGKQWTTTFTEFLHNSINLGKYEKSDPRTLVMKARQLDLELDQIKVLMPEIWHFETIQREQPSEHAYGTVYHVYKDSWIAQMWNNLRSCRMNLYRVVREQIWNGRACKPPLFSKEEATPQIEAAEQAIRTTTAAICASAPQLTGMIDFPQWPARATDKSSAGVQSEADGLEGYPYRIHPPGTFLDPSRPTGMHHLIWPLYTAGMSDLSSDEMRTWVVEVLHFIALRIGTRQAVVLAQGVQEKQRASLRPKALESAANLTSTI